MATYRIADNMPGISAAMKRIAIDWSVKTAYRIINTLGGISEPSVPDAATTPVAKPLS